MRPQMRGKPRDRLVRAFLSCPGSFGRHLVLQGRGGPDADASPPCPPPDQVRKDQHCPMSFLSCPSIENKIPACIGGYEPTTCHCLSGQWSCEFYGIACPDAGGPSVDAPPDRPDR